MDNRNRKLQPSIRPLRSQYRVYRDHDNGRTIYTPYNELGGNDWVEFFANIPTCFLLTYWLWLGLIQVWAPFNTLWPLFGLTWIALCTWQNDSWTRWPVRFVAWGIFWGMLALS